MNVQSEPLELGNYNDYVRLFQWKGGGLPYLITEIFMEHYKKLDCVCVLAHEVWTNFLPRTIVEMTLHEGVMLAQHTDKFNQYRKDFENYQERCGQFFERMKRDQHISHESLTEAFSLMTMLFFYYSRTEFFYLDKAVELSKHDVRIQENLKEFDQIKNGGRAFLNQLFLGVDSYIEDLFRILEKRYSVSPHQLRWYSINEIFALAEGKKVEGKHLHERKKAFIMKTEKGKIRSVEGEVAEILIDGFLHSIEQTNTLTGTIANKGKVRGKARVIHTGYENFDEISKMIETMQEGEILVAETTSPELVIACEKASAILTNQGGMLSHAAIISRELDIPCIVGLDSATHMIEDGDELEVDADKGIVRILKKRKDQD